MGWRQMNFDLWRVAGKSFPVVAAVLGLAVAAAATNRPPAAPRLIKIAAGTELTFDAAISAPAIPPAAASTHTVRMLVTAYCPCKICCGPHAHGITASGRPVSYNGGQFVAADTRLLPFNSQVIVPGYAGGAAVPVIDRGGAIVGNHLDVFFPTHEQALQWGRRWVAVTIVSR